MAYADENYDISRELYNAVAQVFEDYKYGVSSAGHVWNILTNEVRGVTIKFVSEGELSLTYHRYEVADQYDLDKFKIKDPGTKFLSEISSVLKKEFKKVTGKSLDLLKTKEAPINLEKVSRLTAEATGLFSSMNRPQQGRYLVRSTCLYDFRSSLIDG